MKSFTSIATLDNQALMIVDSLNLAFRYKHQRAVNFCDDYMKTVESLRNSYKCGKLIIAGDSGSSTYRRNLYPEYKMNRKDKYADQTEKEKEEFEEFLREVQVILSNYENQGEFPVIRFKGVEADDIAAYIVSRRKRYSLSQIWLISSDRDWNLLVQEGVSQFSYVTRKEFTLDNWNEHYEWSRDDYISIKCLMGDSGDNILGADKVGPKKAAELVKKYGSALDVAASLPISSKYKYIQNLNAFGAENIMLNYKLMDLETFCADAIGEENCKEIDSILGLYLE